MATPDPSTDPRLAHRAEVREFLSNRRVAGLRREEVAMLAGVSVDYYVRMERSDLAGASDGVLDALANALQLDEANASTSSPRPGRG